MLVPLLLLSAQAIAVAPPSPRPGEIERVVEQLGSDSFNEREKASRTLEVFEEVAVPALIEAAWSNDPEIRQRAAVVLQRWQARLRAIVRRLGGKWELEQENPQRRGIWVTLTGRHVHNTDLKRLRWLPGLSGLILEDTAVTDDGVAHLRHHRGLKYLCLEGVPITDEGLGNLRGLTRLEYLNLDRTRLRGPGLAHLKGLSSLSTLCLNGTRVEDAGLAHLGGLSDLWGLGLADTSVTDAGLAHLKGLRRLRSLSLSQTRVTDAGLAHLKGLKDLRRLYLEDADVTRKGVLDLLGAIPALYVTR
jgi:hypothetical protein